MGFAGEEMVGALVVFAVRELPGEEGRQEAGPTASLCKTHPTASLIVISQAQRRRLHSSLSACWEVRDLTQPPIGVVIVVVFC